MPAEEIKKTQLLVQKSGAAAEDLREFLRTAQWIDNCKPSNDKHTLESFLTALYKIKISRNDGWSLEYNLKNLASLLYQRALASQTKNNGWILTETCKTLFKTLGVNDAEINAMNNSISSERFSAHLKKSVFAHLADFLSSKSQGSTLKKNPLAKSHKKTSNSPF